MQGKTITGVIEHNLRYGRSNCCHDWVSRSNANEREDGLIPGVCSACGAFADFKQEDLEDVFDGDPLPSNANPNESWENPFVVKTERKIWI